MFLEYLARVSGDRWENVTPQMVLDFYEGDWTDPKSGRKPGRSEQSRKQRRWGGRRTLASVVALGAIPPGVEVAGCLRPRRNSSRPGISDSDPERIAHVIDTWYRQGTDPAGADPLTAETRKCVTIAAPPSVSTATTMLLSVYLAFEWGLKKFGSINRLAVLHPVNVEALTMDPDHVWSDGWRAQVRSTLRRVGRAVCPEQWPDQPRPIGVREAVAPYDPVDEFMLREAGLMPAREPRCERLALTGLTFGAGLRGTEIFPLGPDDVVRLDGARLGVRVKRDRTRIVPIRKHYTDLIAEACKLRKKGRFFTNDKAAAPSRIAARIKVDNFGHLSIHRARATFVCAHIRAGTPLDALDEIAGPVTGAYLHQMLAYCAELVDPTEAANRGLLA